MEKETKKSVTTGGIIAGGLVAAAVTLGVMQKGEEKQDVEIIDKQTVAREVVAEVRREIQAEKQEYVEAPDKVHTDTMLWLNQYEKQVNAKVEAQEATTKRLTEVVEQLAGKMAEEAPQPDARLLAALEKMAENQQAIEDKNKKLSDAIEDLNRRMSFQDLQMTEDLTRVFEGFDRRFKRFEDDAGPERRTHAGMPYTGLRMVSGEAETQPDPDALEANDRLARIEKLLETKLKDEPDPEGITVDWGDSVLKRPENDHPAPPEVVAGAPEKREGLVRSVVGQAGVTVTGVSDVAANTLNKATNTANGLVKDLTRTTGNALNGTADTAGTAIGGTVGIASEQGKKAWKKFW